MTLRTELTINTANTKPTDGPILIQFNSLTNLIIYIVQTYLNIILLPPCGTIQRYCTHVQISPLAPTHNIHIQLEQKHNKHIPTKYMFMSFYSFPIYLIPIYAYIIFL